MSIEKNKSEFGNVITPVASPTSFGDSEKDQPLAFGDFEHEIGMDLYLKSEGASWTPKEEKTILRKIDWRIMPMFCVTQGLAFLDKTALNYGNLFGMKAGLHVTGSQFSWFASAFYIGYLVSAYPAGVLLQKYPTGKVMGCLAFFWGIVCMTTAACNNFSGALVNRIILGCLEAGVTPGLGLMTPFWWKTQEIPVRHLSWYCFNGVAAALGSLMAYGLGHVTGSKVPTWGLIFLTLGAITTIWGAILFFFLPDSPASAKFLTEQQRVIAIKRVASNKTGTKNTHFKIEQVKEAFMDPKLYILVVAAVAAQVPNGVLTNFSSIIVSGFGFTQLQTTLLEIPSNVVQIVSLVLSGYVATKVKNCRAIVMFVGNIACTTAACCLCYAPRHQTWGRLAAFWMTSCSSVGFAMSLVMVSANVGGYTKRQTMAAATFIAYCVGNIAGPHVVIVSEKPNYPTATKAMLAGFIVKTVAHAALGIYMWMSNKKRDRQALERGENMTIEERNKEAERIGMTDATEFNNPYFRYSL